MLLVNIRGKNSLFMSNRLSGLDMETAIAFLDSDEKDQQVLGAAYIQHECYHHPEAKKQVRASQFYFQPNEVTINYIRC